MPRGKRTIPAIRPESVEKARCLLEQAYLDETRYPGSPVTEAQVRLNLDHVERIRSNARAIARGEGLEEELLELAATLHDIAKLDHREASSGGIDTWHHHDRGASMARRIVLADLGLGGAHAEKIAAMIATHSDIPFIRRRWETIYRGDLPRPRTPEQYALRDADVIDMLWVGGMAKIVHLRQVPDSAFFREDEGDVQKAVFSARCSFDESVAILHTRTAKRMAAARIATGSEFFIRTGGVCNLQEFDEIYHEFLQELGSPT